MKPGGRALGSASTGAGVLGEGGSRLFWRERCSGEEAKGPAALPPPGNMAEAVDAAAAAAAAAAMDTVLSEPLVFRL